MRLRKPALATLAALAVLGGAPAAAQAYATGIGDNDPAMFASPAFKALHTRISRYVVPYNVAVTPVDLQLARTWIQAAESQHIRPLIAFYHARGSAATRLPSVSLYTRDIKRFFKLFPKVKDYTPWNEANRGNVHISGGGSFHSPSAKLSAQYYLAMRASCKRCTIVGLDVLDQAKIGPTIAYIHQFQRFAHGQLPSVWGLHNYSDTNRFRNLGTKAVLAAVRGQVWLTETGGLVKFGGAFPYSLSRAKRAVAFMFRLAASNRRIARLYIFNWFGVDQSARFDAGLVTASGVPRPAYSVVLKQLRHTAHH